MTFTVIVITLNRADCIRRCLECLCAQNPRPTQIIVVDASTDDRTRDVVARFTGVEYLRNRNGFGRMTASRNIGLKIARGDVVAFLDDDAFAHSGWLSSLLETYQQHADAGAVGGRALNNQPSEATDGVDRIGSLTVNGTLHAFFAADPGRVIEVDHIMGCNMSFRREVLAQLGGFRTDYPGISGVREDSDMCLRVKRLGYTLFFNPVAVVDHLGAPQAKGKRFDWRYVYFSQRNHTVMLIRNFGPQTAIVWRGVLTSSVVLMVELGRRIAAATIRVLAGSFGTIGGILAGLRLWISSGRDPVRRDAEGEAIRLALSTTPGESVATRENA